MQENFSAADLSPTQSQSTSKSLVKRLKSNDAGAWERLVHLYGPVIFHWCRKCGLNSSDAADLTQETFQSVAGAIAAFRIDRPDGTFRGWLWMIARNKIRDHARRNQDREQVIGGTGMLQWIEQLPAEAEPPEDNSQDGPVSGLVQRACDLIRTEFNDRAWQAFVRTAVDGCKAPDVAAELAMTPAAVRQAKSRILRRLREELGDAPE